MSIKQGNRVLAAGQSLTHDLFDFKWADHQINDLQWIRADTFSWQDGQIYSLAYQHLLDEWNEVGNNPKNDIIDGTTVYYRLAPDGHKICTASQEDEVLAIYNSTGVAWYYIIDTTNQRFKLPRTKFGFSGLRDTVGEYVSESLPNITGKWIANKWGDNLIEASGAIYNSGGSTNITSGGSNSQNVGLGFDASLSSSTYQDGAPVKERSTQMYLYFFMGCFNQSSVSNTAGLNANLFNNKADLDLSNTPMATADYVVEWQRPTSSNNYEWYRLYKSGWIEQGGLLGITSGSGGSVVLPITMASEYYNIFIQTYHSGDKSVIYTNRTTTGFDYSGNVGKDSWEVKGFAA